MNNEQQQEALNTFTQFIDTLAERSTKFAASQESPAPEKVTEEEQNAYINMMTDLVFTNPYVLVRMEDDNETAEIYHNITTYKDGSKHHGLIIYTNSSNQEPCAHVKAIPFVEIMETFVNDPVWETCQVNPSKELKYILYPQNLEPFLQFKQDNIEFKQH